MSGSRPFDEMSETGITSLNAVNFNMDKGKVNNHPLKGWLLTRNWIRNRNTIEFLGIWEMLNNPNFKPVEFDEFKKQAGLNSFTLTPKQWIEQTNAVGLISKRGRYGGT